MSDPLHEAALDIYPRTVSGRSLPEALATGYEFGTDVGDFADDDAAHAMVWKALNNEGRLRTVNWEGYAIRVHSPIEELEKFFDCQVSSSSASEGGGRLSYTWTDEVGNEHYETRFAPIRLETPARLPGLESCIESIEVADRWPEATRQLRSACEAVGHDWDIIIFGGPAGILKCMLCGEEYRSPPPPRPRR